MMDGRTGGRREGWRSGWGVVGTGRHDFAFCFLLTARSHIRLQMQAKAICPLRLPLSVLPSSSLGLWIILQLGPVLLMPCQGVCLHGYVYVCFVCVCVPQTHTCRSPRTLTNSQWKSVASLSLSEHLEVGILQSAVTALGLDYIIVLGHVCVLLSSVCMQTHKSHILDLYVHNY